MPDQKLINDRMAYECLIARTWADIWGHAKMVSRSYTPRLPENLERLHELVARLDAATVRYGDLSDRIRVEEEIAADFANIRAAAEIEDNF